jgi:hypothetical protein
MQSVELSLRGGTKKKQKNMKMSLRKQEARGRVVYGVFVSERIHFKTK